MGGCEVFDEFLEENAAGLNKDLKASVEPIARYPESHEELSTCVNFIESNFDATLRLNF